MWEGAIASGRIWLAVRALCADCDAASAAEYALLLGIVGGSLVLATISLGAQVGCSLDRSAAIVAGQDPVTGHQYGNSDPNGLAKGHRVNC